MYPTERLAINIARKAKLVLDVDENKEQIIIYGAINLLQTLSAVLCVIFVGLALGVLYEALIFSITAAILRKYSGGVHASSPGRCIIIGTALAAAAGIVIDKLLFKLSLSIVIIIIIIFITSSLIIVLQKAPVDSIAKPITNLELKKMFKRNSIAVILFISILIFILFILYMLHPEFFYIKVIESIGLGLLWQSLTLTNVGILTLRKVDFTIKNIVERRKCNG